MPQRYSTALKRHWLCARLVHADRSPRLRDQIAEVLKGMKRHVQ